MEPTGKVAKGKTTGKKRKKGGGSEGTVFLRTIRSQKRLEGGGTLFCFAKKSESGDITSARTGKDGIGWDAFASGLKGN